MDSDSWDFPILIIIAAVFTFMIGFPVGWKVGSAHANDRILSQCLNTGQTTVAGVKFKCELERQGQQENTDGTPAR